jgi:hypothetical protein
MAGPNWKLEDDNRSVRVTFPTDPPVVLKLGIAGIEEILKNLGEFRAAMKPEIPRKFAMGQKVQAVASPVWTIEPEVTRSDSLLHIRDPRYGWLHYQLSRAEALKLVEFLQAQARSPSESARG